MKKGVIFAFLAYFMWGVFPFYFKALHDVPAIQILGHRFVWSVVFLAIILTVMRGWKDFRRVITGKLVLVYLIASCLLAINWYTYIWSVNNGHIVEASLGYFINPLVNVFLGVVFLKERLKLWQWLPIGLAAVGVSYLTIASGALPWIPLTLAFSFGLYGLMKKIAPLNPLHGLSMETGLLFIPALLFLVYEEVSGMGSFGHLGTLNAVLLMFAGVVTALPLLLFAGAAHRIPLSMMGLVQYVTPTMQFLVGVLAYHEAFTTERMITFCIIWLALLIYSVSGVWQYQKRVRAEASVGMTVQE